MRELQLICALVLLSFMMSACSIRSSQLSSVLELVQGSTEDYSESAWMIRYGDYRAQVQALNFEGGILFSNSLGDQAFFDGWTITKALGLGMLRGSWSVRDDAEGRHFSRLSRLTTFPSCAAWEFTLEAEVTQYTQACPGTVEYSNSILVNAKGEIIHIRQSLNGGASFVTLSKM